MRKVLTGSVAAAMMAVAVQTAAWAGTYIPVPMVEGAVSQIVFSINNHNVVAGSFRDSADVEHGFFGPLDGSNYTVFDFPGEGTTGTQARSINDHGAIVGVALNPKFAVGEEFYRSPNGKFKTFRANGKKLDGIAQGMNASGTSVGDYALNGKIKGYVGQNGKYLKGFALHLNDNRNFLQICPRGLTDNGLVFVGSFVDASSAQHGFLQVNGGKHDKLALVINHPNSTATALQDINDSFVASGQWEDSAANSHAFTIDVSDIAHMKIKDLDPEDGSTYQQAWGINDHGLVAISTSIGQSYIYCPKKNLDKCPASGFAPVDRTTKGHDKQFFWAIKSAIQ